MELLQGYAYHIKDSYFEFVQDANLMQNKEQGNYRPTLYCIKDDNMDLYWMVPITSQYEKFSSIREKILKSGKPCRGIILGKFDVKLELSEPFPFSLQCINVRVKQILRRQRKNRRGNRKS